MFDQLQLGAQAAAGTCGGDAEPATPSGRETGSSSGDCAPQAQTRACEWRAGGSGGGGCGVLGWGAWGMCPEVAVGIAVGLDSSAPLSVTLTCRSAWQ